MSRKLHAWWCLSVNSFKFQLCNQTPPGTETLWFSVREELPIERLHLAHEESELASVNARERFDGLMVDIVYSCN